MLAVPANLKTSQSDFSFTFKACPSEVGLHLEVRYPTESDVERLGIRDMLDVNVCIDSILNVVYANALGDTNSRATRRIVFSSFSPVACGALNWKQPNCECVPYDDLSTLADSVCFARCCVVCKLLRVIALNARRPTSTTPSIRTGPPVHKHRRRREICQGQQCAWASA